MRRSAFFFATLAMLVLFGNATPLRAQQASENWTGQAEASGSTYPAQYTVYKDAAGQTEMISVNVQSSDPNDTNTQFQITQVSGQWRVAPCHAEVCPCQVQENPGGGGTASCEDPGKPEAGTVVYRILARS